MSSFTYSASNEANLMKVKYGKLIEKQFNKENVLFGRSKMKKTFVGSQIEIPVIQSIGGGVSAGSLPTANENKTAKATITSKKLYAVTSVDRETMKASKTDEGSFVRFTAFPVKIATQSFNRNLERMSTRGAADGNGALITGHASNTNVSGAGSSGDPYVVTFDAAAGNYYGAHAECFEIGDIINADTETTELEVTDVQWDEANKSLVLDLVGSSVKLAADTGAAPFVESFYMQKSKDNECVGLQGALSATSGSLYGITVGRRWQAYQKDASSASLSSDLINDVVLGVKKQCGASPKWVLSSYKQYVAALNLQEDQKRYSLPARDKKFKASISFSGVEIMTADGPIGIFPSRFMDDDKMYFLNDDHLEWYLRPGGFEWFDEDGTVFLRESGDSYEARYGGYGQYFINPHFQGYLHSLA